MTDHLPPSNSDTNADAWDAIARFLAGESTPAQAAEVRQWLTAHPDDAHVVASLDALLPVAAAAAFRSSAEPAFTGPVDVEGALKRMHVNMQTARTAEPLIQRPKQLPKSLTRVASVPSKSSRWPAIGIAAAAVLIVASGVTRWQSSSRAVPATAITYDTKVGSADSITLPDSSKVVLAPGSRLVVAANYGLGQRDVELQGAGQFTVRHDSTRPFTVRVGSAVIRDLGTVFGVKSSNGAGVSVSVTQGSVALSDSSVAGQTRSVRLSAGDRGRVLADGSVKSEPGTVTSDELSWVTGTLVYRDASLAEVQADLRRWYGVELVVRDSAMAMQTISTQGVTSESVDKIIERLASALGGVVPPHNSSSTIFIDKPGARFKH